MKIYTAAQCPQRSEQWQRMHIGLPTASEFHKIVTPTKLELAAGRKELMYRLAAERLLGQSFAKSLDGLQWIEIGKEQEGEAVREYEALHDVETVEVGFVVTDDGRLGCSPDRLVVGDDKRAVEIKSLFAPKMMRYLLEGPGPEHRVQVLGQMFVADLDIADLYARNRETPPYYHQWFRSEVKHDIVKLAGHLDQFCEELELAVHELNLTGFFTHRTRPATMLDQLVETMIGDIERLDTIGDIERWLADAENASNVANLPADMRERVKEIAAHRQAFMAASTP